MTAVQPPSDIKQDVIMNEAEQQQPYSKRQQLLAAQNGGNGNGGSKVSNGDSNGSAAAPKRLSRKEASNRTRAYQFALTEARSSAD